MTDTNDLIQQRALADALAAKARSTVNATKPAPPSSTLQRHLPSHQNNTANLAGENISDPSELLRLIGMIRDVESVSQSAQRLIVIGEFSVPAARIPDTFIAQLQMLSRMEAATLRILGWGRANHDIALLLNSTEATVRTHMSNMIKKLNLDGMRELIVLGGLLFHPLD